MIVNLTQHQATAEQLEAGVVDLRGIEKERLVELLTVEDLPSSEEIEARCADIAQLAAFNGLGGEFEDPAPLQAMIGGAPWMMPSLERALLDVGVTPIYAFSKRESSEKTNEDGLVIKTQIFRHIGFVVAVEVAPSPI
jgi:hypothetical protein